MFKKLKGQGALEYLLLIGGAIVVAVIVVTLLLGVGGSTNAQTLNSAAAAACTQKALQFNSQAPDCEKVSTSTEESEQLEMWYNGTCWECGGTYPNCTATETNPKESQEDCANPTEESPSP